jgi:hypothetical protein
LPEHLRAQKAARREHRARIARGIAKFVKVDPFIVPVMHAGDARVHSLREPVRTITGAKRGELALVRPFIAGIDNKSNGASSAWRQGAAAHDHARESQRSSRHS